VAASRATETVAAISSQPAPDNVRRHAGTVLRPLPAAAEVTADRFPPAQVSPASHDRDSFAVTALADIIDGSLHAAVARFTAGLSPAALAHAYLDWVTHLTYSPGKRLQLVDKATRKAVRFTNYASRCAVAGHEAPCCIEPLPQDKRFAGEGWHKWPYNLVHQAFLLHQQWWHNATTGIRGVTKQH
jgi:polyhydroxyalkanoate synthase subunit PhaC